MGLIHRSMQGMFLALALTGLLIKPGSASSNEKVFGVYEPSTNVDNIAVIDLDQRMVAALLAQETEGSMEAAKNVYLDGTYVRSYAVLALSRDLSQTVQPGTAVIGRTANNAEVRGVTNMETADGWSKNFIGVEYSLKSEPCSVGGSPEPDIRGCFAPSGVISIEGIGQYSYTYDPYSENYNDLSLQDLSEDAQERFFQCARCPLPTYRLFLDYYGEFDYADWWLAASFDGTSTSFENGNAMYKPNANFSNFDLEGRGAAIKLGTVVLNTWMAVVGSIEGAVNSCDNLCAGQASCNIYEARDWDEAVAIYTGSLPMDYGSDGYLLYTLAQKECENFGTCNKEGTAAVNSQIFDLFEQGKDNLLKGNCAEAEQNTKRIVTLMKIPLLQGLLRTSYELDIEDNYSGMVQGEAAAFAASIQPILHSCSVNEGFIIYNDLKPGKGSTSSFEVIKAALERIYDCLGVTCDDVGGLLNLPGNAYLDKFETCNGKVLQLSRVGGSGGTSGVIIGVIIGVIALALIAVLVGREMMKKKKEHDTAVDSDANKVAAMGETEENVVGAELELT